MKNYGHRFASGVIILFYTAVIVVLRNNFNIDFFRFCEKFNLFREYEVLGFILIALFLFPQAIFLDNLVEKYELTIEQRDKMYFSIMGVSIIVIVLSFIF